MRRSLALAIVALTAVGGAGAHSPATAIGRAVKALGQVPVSYDSGSAATDVEAGGFPQIVGTDVKVAFMPASANDEISGGPDAVAAEIAREANLDGTLVVLVGAELQRGRRRRAAGRACSRGELHRSGVARGRRREARAQRPGRATRPWPCPGVGPRLCWSSWR